MAGSSQLDCKGEEEKKTEGSQNQRAAEGQLRGKRGEGKSGRLSKGYKGKRSKKSIELGEGQIRSIGVSVFKKTSYEKGDCASMSRCQYAPVRGAHRGDFRRHIR